jgi:glutamyl-tRNA reductase
MPEGWRVLTAARHGHPAVAASLEEAVRLGIEKLVVLPTHPHFSRSTTGTVLRHVYAALAEVGQHLDVSVRASWCDDGAYVNALARRIAEHACAHELWPEQAHLRFTAPLFPALTDEGDEPYRRQVQRTAELVAERAGWPRDRLSLVFESPPPTGRGTTAVPPARGLEDAEEGGLLVCALPLAGDASRPPAPPGVCASLHDYPPFISCLRSIALNGAVPAPARRGCRAPLLRKGADAAFCAGEPATLVLVGASVASSLGSGRGPDLRYCNAGVFSKKKSSRKALRAALKWMRDETPLYEALIWSTCQRVELYAWLPELHDPREREDLVRRIRRVLFGNEPPGFEVNVLTGSQARHHLMRTACGLNSDLPGDRDVAAQLDTARRIARSAGTLGPRSEEMVDGAIALAGDVHGRTAWGRYSSGYCAAALARVVEDELRPLHELRHLVIGGSTTSRSVLTALAEEQGVPHRHMTVIYRDHHGQMKQLRCAVGCGTRLRVHSYWDERVLQSIAAADFVFLGIDQPDPVIDLDLLHEMRDFGSRPLTIVDFNSFGSVGGAPPPEGVTVWNSDDLDNALLAHAAITASRSGFLEALAEAEDWIGAWLSRSAPEATAASARGG